MMLDRVIFGDNQFFGINHMSEEKAQALTERFGDLNAIIGVIDTAYDAGLTAFMLNSNDRAKEICDHLRNHPSRYENLKLYPSIPYPHKYANAVGEKGIFGALHETLIADNTAGGIIGSLAKGSMSFFERDMIKVMELLIDIEMRMFRDLNVKVIFLQNVVTDLLLGFGVKEVFIAFYDYIKKKYGVEPGFITVNLPQLVNLLLDCGIEDPIVCSSINKIGQSMNPNRMAYEQTISEKRFRPIAMSILASGAVKPKEAVEYVCRQPKIQSIVFGASSRQHIVETKELIESYS